MFENLFIRDAQREDARDIAILYQQSGGGVAEYLWSLLQSEYPGLSLLEIGIKQYERINIDFSYQNCLVAERFGEVLGMAHSYPITEKIPSCDDPILKPYCNFEHGEDAINSLYISGIAVYPDHRSQGIGSLLMKSTVDRAQNLGLSKLSLIVFEQNSGAAKLYERLGFQEIDRNKVTPHDLIQYAGDVVLMTADVT